MLKVIVGFCIIALVAAPTWSAAEKPFFTQPPSGAFVCPPGATTLCIPLDASFTVVDFSEQPCSGPSSGTDPCQRNDDDFSFSVALPFSFDLYGSTYSSVFINNNGNLSFDSGFCSFTSTGFPVSGFPMVAPFWADVDTRNEISGVVYYRLEANRLTVIWDHVGYFSAHGDLLSTFQVIITDGTDPLVGIGNNVCFCYDDMQWTTGDASGGVGGFGGVPATVGVNKGDGVNYAQIGLFDHEGVDYDGPGGSVDGVSYLDGEHFCFTTSTGGGENIPPIALGFPDGNVLTVCVGACDTLSTGFASPEVGQTTTVTGGYVVGGIAGTSFSSTPGNPSSDVLIVCPTQVMRSDPRSSR